LLQLEVSLETTLAAAQTATGIVLLDPAPAPAEGLPVELLEAVDIVAPNETELALLAQRSVDAENIDDVIDAARGLPVDNVVVTLGSRGAVVVGDVVAHVPAPEVNAVDTTAAGDAFRSALATQLASGRDLVDAAAFAVRVGAATTLRFGAQPSLPTAAEGSMAKPGSADRPRPSHQAGPARSMRSLRLSTSVHPVTQSSLQRDR